MALEFKLDSAAKVAPFRQIAEQLRSAIISGALAAGEQLPSVRELAGTLSVNPLTVARALNELESSGLIESRWGKGNFVKTLAETNREDARRQALEKAAREFLGAAERLGFKPAEAIKALRSV
jgi:GntR family transcriptional regulator